MTSNAVQQAVSLLRVRRDEAALELVALNREIAEIVAALDSLGALDSSGSDSQEPRSPSPSETVGRAVMRGLISDRKGTIRSAVRSLFESTPESLSVDDVVAHLRGEHQGRRTDDSFRSTIRTSLWSLRNADVIRTTGPKGYHIAVKWLPTNAETPAATGVSGDEGSNSDPSQQEGGTADGAEPLRGDDPTARRAQDGRAHDLRASVMEATG